MVSTIDFPEQRVAGGETLRTRTRAGARASKSSITMIRAILLVAN